MNLKASAVSSVCVRNGTCRNYATTSLCNKPNVNGTDRSRCKASKRICRFHSNKFYIAAVRILLLASLTIHYNKSIKLRVTYGWQCKTYSRFSSSSNPFRIQQPAFLAEQKQIQSSNYFFRNARPLRKTKILMMDQDNGNVEKTTSISKSANATSTTSSTTTNFSKPSSLFLRRSVLGPDVATKPDYDNIVGPLGKAFDTLFIVVFRKQLAKHVGWDSVLPLWDYNGIIEITQYMNRTFLSRKQIQQTSQEVLLSLFPSWLPKQFGIMFSQPFPIFSARLNAWATFVAGTWLMGECEVNDVVVTTNDMSEKTMVLEKQGLYVKRCRFLEESSCASVCVNSCKIPTQNFFQQNMNLPLRMEPNYTTYECQFSFGVSPTDESELVALSTPCLSRCPTFGSIRQYHEITNNLKNVSESIMKNDTLSYSNDDTVSSNCAIMMD